MSKVFQVELTFTEPLLGTVPLNKDIYTDYIASGAPAPVPDEVETVPVNEQIEKGTTGFHRVNGDPILYDYIIKGFAKDACSMLSRVPDTKSKELKAYKKVIDGLLFISPRQIPILVNGEIGILERPLRAQTAQGERVALARSETVPAGSIIAFEAETLGGISEALLGEWFDYGRLRGLGAWRNASWGRFTYTIKVVDRAAAA